MVTEGGILTGGCMSVTPSTGFTDVVSNLRKYNITAVEHIGTNLFKMYLYPC